MSCWSRRTVKFIVLQGKFNSLLPSAQVHKPLIFERMLSSQLQVLIETGSLTTPPGDEKVRLQDDHTKGEFA